MSGTTQRGWSRKNTERATNMDALNSINDETTEARIKLNNWLKVKCDLSKGKIGEVRYYY